SDCSPGLFCDGTRFVDGRFAEGAYCTAYCADRNDCGPADHPVSGCMACGQTNSKERRKCFPIKDCIRGCRGDDDCNVAIGERCSVKRVDSDYGGPYVAWGCTGKCLAGALPPGSQCTSDSECCSPFCVRGKCAGPCLGDEDCTLGSQCVARLYVDVGMPGCASSLLTMCAPGGGSAKTCGSDGECPAGEDCAFWSFAGDEVVFRCRSPNAGGASFGGECTEDMDCQSGLCAPEGFCVSPCRTDSDCAAPGGAGVCGVAVLPRTGGVAACNPAVGSGSVCGRDGDCPPGEVCGAFRRLDGPRRFACVVPEKKGPGAACESDHECGTGLCLREYCAPVCASDTDCSPTSGLVWTCGMNEADSEGGAARACIPVAGSGAACGGNGDCAAPGEVCKPILVSETLLVGRCGVASNNGDAPGASAGEACAGCADPCLCRTVRCEADLCLAGRCVELCKETADCEEAGMVCDLPAGPGPGVCANRGS
ncbi:MAG: hypothetical protein HY897_17625, partial [Deltaproteobacteria bacterium]|nr:hypothetical protein [Deltaproteobacteria bacterium]